MDAIQFLQFLFAGGVGGILSALALYIRARGQNRVETRAQQDTYLIKLIDALNADEGTFRAALLDTIKAQRQELIDEQQARRDLDARLTTTQSQLTAMTLERDLARRELDQTKLDLNQAHEKIRHLETEIAQLRAQQGG